MEEVKTPMSAASVMASMASVREAGRGSNPTAALPALKVAPIPAVMAKRLIEQNHYLHSYPGGTKLNFGVFLSSRLMGAATLGAGPYLAYSLVKDATPDDCITLTRLWLSDELPRNSESRVLAILLRALKHNTSLKFILAYSDPAEGHVGTIYQAMNWLYTGLSSAMPLYDVGDGKLRPSRSLAHMYGSHSLRYFAKKGIEVKLVQRQSKYRYVYFLDSTWQSRLAVPIKPYPKKEIPK